MLGISNWHFNRDTQHLIEGPRCKLDDINLTFKLASSAFNVDEAGNSSTPSASNQATDGLKYDRNGATVPYSAFVSLLEEESFHAYIRQIKELYEQKEGPIQQNDLEDERDAGEERVEEEEEEEEEEELVKKKRKRTARVLSEVDESAVVDDNTLTTSDQQPTNDQPVSKSAATTRRTTKKTNHHVDP